MPPKPTMPRVCRQCGREFLATAAAVASGSGLYCGRACSGLAQRTRIARTCERCGASFEAVLSVVKSGHARYCGQACAGAAKRTHGEASQRRTPEYVAWLGMKQRCFSPRSTSYKHYGGRGITVCAAWRASFETFRSDMGRRPSPDHSLDRIDNDGDYEPGNVRWAPPSVQGRNRSVNRRLTVNGVTRSLVEWSEQVHIGPETLSRRLQLGWTPERAVTTPLRGNQPNLVGGYA